jgi:hypothetical protein
MAPFRNSIRVAHRSSLQSYEKICPLDHLFLAPGSVSPGHALSHANVQNSLAASAAHPFNRSQSFSNNDRSVAAMQDTAKVQIAFALKRNSKLGRRGTITKCYKPEIRCGFSKGVRITGLFLLITAWRHRDDVVDGQIKAGLAPTTFSRSKEVRRCPASVSYQGVGAPGARLVAAFIAASAKSVRSPDTENGYARMRSSEMVNHCAIYAATLNRFKVASASRNG